MSLGQSSSSSFQSSLCWGREWTFVFISALFADDFLDAVLRVLLKKNLCASKWRLILETPLRGESIGQRKGLAMPVLSSPERCDLAGSRHGQERYIPL